MLEIESFYLPGFLRENATLLHLRPMRRPRRTSKTGASARTSIYAAQDTLGENTRRRLRDGSGEMIGRLDAFSNIRLLPAVQCMVTIVRSRIY
jgi:hypothetical protein